VLVNFANWDGHLVGSEVDRMANLPPGIVWAWEVVSRDERARKATRAEAGGR
jgi:hypothetical protein